MGRGAAPLEASTVMIAARTAELCCIAGFSNRWGTLNSLTDWDVESEWDSEVGVGNRLSSLALRGGNFSFFPVPLSLSNRVRGVETQSFTGH